MKGRLVELPPRHGHSTIICERVPHLSMLASVRCHRAALFIGALVLGGGALDCQQSARVDSADEKPLREYTGPYRWDQNRFVYLQLWCELSGKNQLVAFD